MWRPTGLDGRESNDSTQRFKRCTQYTGCGLRRRQGATDVASALSVPIGVKTLLVQRFTLDRHVVGHKQYEAGDAKDLNREGVRRRVRTCHPRSALT